METRKVKIPVFRGDLVVHVVDDLNEIEKKYDVEPLAGSDACVFRHNTKKVTQYVVAFEWKYFTNGVIAHEAVHVVCMLFHDVGIKLDVENDEIMAYMLEWVVNQIHKTI